MSHTSIPQASVSDDLPLGLQDLVHSGSCPEIQGFLHVKDSARKSWKRAHFFLRPSGLYSSSKGASKEPRHLQYVADLRDLYVYNVVNARKLYAAPQNFCFAITVGDLCHACTSLCDDDDAISSVCVCVCTHSPQEVRSAFTM